MLAALAHCGPALRLHGNGIGAEVRANLSLLIAAEQILCREDVSVTMACTLLPLIVSTESAVRNVQEYLHRPIEVSVVPMNSNQLTLTAPC